MSAKNTACWIDIPVKDLERAVGFYSAVLKEPNLHASLVKRIVAGNVVVDHEKVTRTFPEGTGELELVAIYEVQNGRIAKAWFIFGAKILHTKS